MRPRARRLAALLGLAWLLACLAAPAALAWAGQERDQAAPGAPALLEIGQAVALALERNPGLGVGGQDVAVAQAQLTQGLSAYYPQLAAQSAYQRQWQDGSRSGGAPAYGGAGGQGQGQGQNDYYSNQLSVSQYIYDFGQTSGQVERSRQNLAYQRKTLQKTRAELVRDVKSAFFEVLKQEELTRVYGQALEVQEQHLAQARAFYRLGTKAKLEVTKSEVEVANTQLQLIQARLALQTAQVNLETLLGGPPLPGPYRLAPVEGAPPAPPALAQLVPQALEARPEVGGLEAQIAGAQAQLEAAQAGFLPSLNANGAYGWAGGDSPLQESWQVGASLNWQLFSGLRTQGQVSEARADLRKAQEQMRQLELAVRQDVSVALLKLTETAKALETARVAQGQAEENMHLAEGRWKVGVGSSLEYSDARYLLTQAQGNLVQAHYQEWQAQAELERAQGLGLPEAPAPAAGAAPGPGGG